MKRKAKNILLLVLCVMCLQQLSYWLGRQQTVFSKQKELMIQHNIDPSVFFYTESEEALAAEKKIRRAIEK